MTLLKEGQVEIDGEIKVKEEGTLYNPGELPLLEWYNKMMEAQHKELQPAHTPYTMKTLEQEIADIIKENPDYQSASCVGYRAYLKKGDIVGIKSNYNNGEWFINGKRVEANYSYNGSGTELVSVVGFDTGYYIKNVPAAPITLGATPSYYPFEIYIKNIGQVPTVAQNYYVYAEKITTFNFVLEVRPRGCRVLVANGSNYFYQQCPVAPREIYSDCVNLESTILKSNAYIYKISLPECKTISSTSAALSSLGAVRVWEFGKLKTLTGGSNYGTGCLFRETHTVLIPSTVKNINNVICGHNTVVKMECNEATYIHSKWYNGGNAPGTFTMADDWYATVNISYAARGWVKEQFIDLFQNKLRPINPEGGTTAARTITIPVAIADTLYDEGIVDIALDKGWMIDEA